MAVSTENAAAEIQGWLKDNVTGDREVPPDEPLIENGVLTSLQTVELVTFHDLLRNSVERDPSKVAIVDGAAGYTYEDLGRQSNALCAALQEAGVKKGDRVGVYMEKSWEAIVAMLATSLAGAAYVNIK